MAENKGELAVSQRNSRYGYQKEGGCMPGSKQQIFTIPFTITHTCTITWPQLSISRLLTTLWRKTKWDCRRLKMIMKYFWVGYIMEFQVKYFMICDTHWNICLSSHSKRGTQVREEKENLIAQKENQVKLHNCSPCHLGKSEKRTSGLCSSFGCPHIGQPWTVAFFL